MRAPAVTSLVLLLAVVLPSAPFAGAAETTLTIDATATREVISPYVYGQFIEHLGRCIYGGLWAEMLEDRKFFYPSPARRRPGRCTPPASPPGRGRGTPTSCSSARRG